MSSSENYRRVLIAYDFSEASQDAFYKGIELATLDDAEAWVLHVTDPISATDRDADRYREATRTIQRLDDELRARLDEVWEEGGIHAVDRRKVNLWLRAGEPASEILATAQAKDIDLIVLGANARDEGGASLGPVAERVAREAPCSVLTVRHQPAES